MTLCSLTQIFVGHRLPEQPVASLHGEVISFARFAADVGFNAQIIRAAHGQRALLITQDVYWGAVGLLAAAVAGADVVLAPNDVPSTVQQIRETCSVTVICPGAENVAGALRLAHAPCQLAVYGLPPGELAGHTSIIFFTSGTTGEAKQIVKNLAQLELEAQAIEALFGPIIPATARVEGTVTHQHAYGIAFRLAWPLASGRMFAAETHLHLESCLAALDRNTMLVTSPAHLNRLDGLAPLPAERTPRFVLSAGAVLPQAAVEACQKALGIAPFEIFGSTETGAIAGRQRGRAEPGWAALPGVAIGADASGLLTARAGHIPEAYHTTADFVAIELDGTFRVLGRSDSIVKIEGKRVGLLAVERALTDLELVAEAAALVVGGAMDRLAAVIVLSAAGRDLKRQLGELHFQLHLRTALRTHLEPAAMPRLWRFVDTLQSGALGKRRRMDLTPLFDKAAPGKIQPEVHATRALQDGVEIDLSIPPDLAYLDGHFPEMPILPGVVQLDWAVGLARQHLGLTLESARTFQVKYRKIISPGTQLTLRLQLLAGPPRLTFQYAASEQVFSSGTIALPPLAGPGPAQSSVPSPV